jgi:site-specific recombinase XerD
MANAFFRLRKVKAKTPQIIYVGYRFGNDQLIYPTGIKILPDYWNFTKSEVKHMVSNPHPNRDLINTKLKTIKNFIDFTAQRYQLEEPKRELTKPILKNELDNFLNPPKVHKITFYEFIEQFINDCKTGKRLNDGARIAERTIKNYSTGFNGLKEYETYTGEEITFESLTRQFWQEYVHYLTMVKKYKVNTIGSYQKYLIVFLKECKTAKLWKDEDGLLDIAKVMTENPVDIYLNKNEIAKIENLDLSTHERLDRVRDLFLIGLNTGFRVSDWYQVSNENIKHTDKENAYIEITQTKTKQTATTPLRPIVSDILRKYNNQLPIISEQKINDYLKELCKMAGINQKVKTTATIGGHQQTEFFEKWEQVTTHTARRSFATNLFRDGVSPNIIMKATGHSTEKNFKKYLKLDNSEFMDMLAEQESNN